MERFEKVVRFLDNNSYAEKVIHHPDYRAWLTLIGSASINIAYSVFKFITGFIHGSLWIGAIAVYYFLVSVLRYVLIYQTHKNAVQQDERIYKTNMLKSYEVTGWWMLALNVLIMAFGGQMLWVNRTYNFPPYILVGGACFTLFCLCNSIYNLIKNRKLQHPLFAATKNISLTCSLLSILSFQTSLIAQFGDFLSPSGRRISNSVTGALVMIAIFSIAIRMIVQGRLACRKIKKESFR